MKRLLLLALVICGLSCRSAKQSTQPPKTRSRLLGGHGESGGNAQGQNNGANGKDGKAVIINVKAGND